MDQPDSETQAWLETAGRAPLLTREEEILLGRRIQAAAGIDPATTDRQEMRTLRMAARARERFVAANLRLVYKIANAERYRRAVPSYGFVDLLQAGAEGVHHATSKFDPARGFKFSTYSAWWIRQRIQLELEMTSRTIRPPRTITPALGKLSRAGEQLLMELGRAPTAAELGLAVGLSEEEVSTAILRARAPLSLDRLIGDGLDGDSIGERLSTPGPVEDQQLDDLREAMARLPRLQRMAVKASYLPEGPTLAAFARAEGLSMRRARKCLKLGLARLEKLRPEPTLQLQLLAPDPAVNITSMKHGQRHCRRTQCGYAEEGQLELA